MEYRHTQTGYVILLCGAGAFIVLLEIFFRKASGVSLFIGLAAILLMMGLFGTLTVEIRNGTLKFRFGLGLIRKTLKIADIESFAIVKNPWYYGWGIHATSKGWIYNVSGFHAVEIFVNDGRRMRLGTDEPELLRKAILTAQMEMSEKAKNKGS